MRRTLVPKREEVKRYVLAHVSSLRSQTWGTKRTWGTDSFRTIALATQSAILTGFHPRAPKRAQGEVGQGMARRRNLVAVIVVLLVAAAIAVIVYWHGHAAPQAVRLLPESDTVIYLDLRPIRKVTDLGKKSTPPDDPDYRQFLAETGFDFERDLDQLAIGVVAPNWGATGPLPGSDIRSSEVFVGRFDARKIAAYLKKMAISVDSFRGVDIYSIPYQGHTVRAAILAVDQVAVTNVDDPETIRGIIERARTAGSPFGGPELVQQHYKDIPFGTVAWGLARIPASLREDSSPALPIEGGISMGLFPPGSVIVGSLQYKNGIALTAQTITPSNEEARRITDKFQAYLAIFQSLAGSEAQGTDPDVKALFDSLKAEQQGNKMILSATVPPGFLKKALTEPPAPPAPAPAPEPPPKKAAKKKHAAK